MILGGDGTARDDVMDVGVILELSSPGMEDAEETGQIAADELWIRSELFHGSRGSGKQGGVGEARVAADEGTEVLRDGEGDEEMRRGEMAVDLALEPLAGFSVLTLGTMAVAAAAEYDMSLATLLTAVDG